MAGDFNFDISDILITLSLRLKLYKDRDKFIEELIANHLLKESQTSLKNLCKFVRDIIKVSCREIESIVQKSHKFIENPKGLWELKKEEYYHYYVVRTNFIKNVERIIDKYFPFGVKNKDKLQRVIIRTYIKILENAKLIDPFFNKTLVDHHREISKILDDINLPKGVDRQIFKEKFIMFLKTEDIDAKRFQGILIQNYIYIKAFANPQMGKFIGNILSDTELYLDTPVVFSLVIPNHPLHDSSMLLFENAKRLKIPLKIFSETDEEFKATLRDKLSKAFEIINKHPDVTELDNDEFEIDPFIRYVEMNKKVGIQEFQDLYDITLENYQKLHVEVENTNKDVIGTARLNQLTKQLQEIYKNLHKNTTGREKAELSAVRDVLVLKNLQRRKESGKNVYLITPDTSLPGFLNNEEGYEQPLVLTLDTAVIIFMQHEPNDEKIYEILPKLVLDKLIPHTNLDMEKIQIFKEVINNYKMVEESSRDKLWELLKSEIRKNPSILRCDTNEFREFIHSLVEEFYRTKVTSLSKEVINLKEEVYALRVKIINFKDQFIQELKNQREQYKTNFINYLTKKSIKDIENLTQKFENKKNSWRSFSYYIITQKIPYVFYLIIIVLIAYIIVHVGLSLISKHLKIPEILKNTLKYGSWAIPSIFKKVRDFLNILNPLQFKNEFSNNLKTMEIKELEKYKGQISNKIKKDFIDFGLDLNDNEVQEILSPIYKKIDNLLEELKASESR